MAGRRPTRFDLPPDPAAMLRALRVTRQAATDALRHLKIGGPAYKAAQAIIDPIDAMATLLTGDAQYFWAKGGGASAAQREALADQAERELGEKPWT